jgi:ankyrin repeat protein
VTPASLPDGASLAGTWPQSQGFRPEVERVILLRAKVLLDAGAQLNVRDEWDKSTPLGTACKAGRVELVKLFLQGGADPFRWMRNLAPRREHGS